MASEWALGWNAVSAIAESITAAGIFVILFQVWVDQKRSRNEAALRLLIEAWRNRPVNSRHSLAFVASLDGGQFKALFRRQEFNINKNQIEQALSCFSDRGITELNELYSDGKVTRKGASLLAQRVNSVLDQDEAIVIALNRHVADSKMILAAFERSIGDNVKRVVDLYSAYRRAEAAENGNLPTGGSDATYYPAIVDFFSRKTMRENRRS